MSWPYDILTKKLLRGRLLMMETVKGLGQQVVCNVCGVTFYLQGCCNSFPINK